MVDVRKPKAAFDSIYRQIIWKYLEYIEGSGYLIQKSKSNYNMAKTQIRINGNIRIRIGQEGDTCFIPNRLNPLLFNIVIDRVMKNSKARTNKLQTIIGYKKIKYSLS